MLLTGHALLLPLLAAGQHSCHAARAALSSTSSTHVSTCFPPLPSSALLDLDFEEAERVEREMDAESSFSI